MNYRNERIKVAFYLDNQNIVKRNLDNVEDGNPGIGGSQYMQLLVAHCLAECYKDLEIVMYTTAKQQFPKGITVKQVSGLKEALVSMKQDRCRVFILSNWYEDTGDGTETLRLIERHKIRTIIWAHLFMNYEQYVFIGSCKYIRLYVCLGKQQLEMLRGLKIYKKATYINYVLPPVHMPRRNQERKIVVYVGAMYSFKGFHILAKHWKEIRARVKDAELWVLGSANLYRDNVVLGKYKIAEEDYEKQFMPYLVDANGQIVSSVRFFGSVGGNEKEQIVSQATVGIFNPSGVTETFGLSGVEFEAMGIPVVSIYKNSAPDIIKHGKTGLLYKKESDFPEYIIRLLTDSAYNHILGKQAEKFVRSEFDKEKIVKEWHDTIVDIAQDEPYRLKHDKKFMADNQIWLHHMNNLLKGQTTINQSYLESRIHTGW